MTIKEISEFSIGESVNFELEDGTTLAGEIASIEKQLSTLSIKLSDGGFKEINYYTIKASYPVISAKVGLTGLHGSREPGGGPSRKPR